jgi:DNA-binding CsgD family transcriptional regulator
LNEFRHLIAADQPAPQYSHYAIRIDAEYAVAVGDHERAWSDSQLFLDHAHLYSASAIYPLLVSAATAARVLDSADHGNRLDVVRGALETAKHIGVRRAWQPVIEAALDDTADGWRRAWKASVDEEAPAHLAPYAGLRLAQHLVVSRDRAEAREVLTSATDLAAKIGADLLTGRLTALAQRAGLSTEPPTDGNRLAGLTAREVEVLQLVADGKSNGEIGVALFISTKTASVHVSNILAKLGVNTRGEAAALAHRRGLVSAV